MKPAAIALLEDAIELEQRKPPVLARLTVWLLVLLVVVAVVWAAVSPVDRIVVARGKLITTAPTMVVQTLETSMVRTIEVSPGDVVRRGARLATLDATFAEADLEQVRGKIASLAPQVDRLEAELDLRPFRPTSLGHHERLQLSIYDRRIAQYNAKLEALDRQIARAEAGLATKQADRQAIQQRLGVAREIEGMRTQLAVREVGSKLQQLEAQNTRLQLERELMLAGNEMLELREEIARAKAERESWINEWRQKAAEELVTAKRELEAAEKQSDKAERRSSLVTLNAPADAVVLDIAQRSIGSVLREAEPFITLVPLDVPLEAEVNIDAKDIGLVNAGATGRLKLDAFPFQKHGVLEGSMRTVSEDAFAEKDKPAYYRGRLSLGPMTLRDVPPTTRLIPGMAVTAEIKSGERTVLSYFLYPLLRGLDESIREP
jgi:hemolysin D